MISEDRKVLVDLAAAEEKEDGQGGSVSLMFAFSAMLGDVAACDYIAENYLCAPHFTEEEIEQIRPDFEQSRAIRAAVTELETMLDGRKDDALASMPVAGHA